MKLLKFIPLVPALTFGMVSLSHAALLGPIGGSGISGEYASFADSPFKGLAFSYFHLENFEDGALNTPGVIATGNELRVNAVDDSVDADDGVIDGNGSKGIDMWAWGIPGITFEFNDAQLGHLPTHVGIVWTDGINPITFEAYDANGALLGNIVGNHADAVHNGTTADDRFYGAIYSSGISKIVIYNGSNTGDSGIEVDHLQYGYVPIPSALVLFGTSLVGIAGVSLRRRLAY